MIHNRERTHVSALGHGVELYNVIVVKRPKERVDNMRQIRSSEEDHVSTYLD